VRQPVQAEERGAALEVDQNEVEVLGGVGDGQPEHERPQQFGLAGSGRADDQAMRAHAALRRLLDVEFHRAAVGAVADRHPQPVPRRPGLPQGGHVQRAQAVDAEQRAERWC